MPGALVLVATPIGNLEDMTLRGLRSLREADLIAAEDTRHTAKLLTHFGITTPTVSLHEHNERSRIPELLDRVRRGGRVAVVTDAGMPAISDPGYAVVAATVDAGLSVEVIPGVSALTAALAGAGLPTEMVTFLGFPPSRTGERARWLSRWRETRGVLVLFEAPHRVRATLEALAQALGNRPVVVAHELTKVHESWHRGPVDMLIADKDLPAKGEFTILVGPAPDGVGRRDAAARLAPEQVGAEFGLMTKDGAMTRRDAIAELARRHGLRKRQVYSMVEAAKYSGE
jgi:16S rRNA (cytidine1402-2'-O)-methyltransferase